MTAPSPRRWPRFSLRMMLLVIAVSAAGLGLLSRWIAAKQREERARQWIMREGGGVGRYTDRDLRWREWWVRGLSLVLPRECFYAVHSVSFEKADDATLARFVDLPHVREVNFDGARITDRGIAHLRHLDRLEFLELSETLISDAGLAHLQHNRRVKQFWLEKTQVTDASLPFIAKNRGLTHLDLDDTRVTDAGVDLLAGLPELEVLALRGTKVTPRVMTTMEQLPKLKYLYLKHTAIDDSVVPQLGRLAKLSQIDLRFTQITPAGCAELRQALPSCTIEYETQGTAAAASAIPSSR